LVVYPGENREMTPLRDQCLDGAARQLPGSGRLPASTDGQHRSICCVQGGEASSDVLESHPRGYASITLGSTKALVVYPGENREITPVLDQCLGGAGR
jgi:hypothetical protein